MYRENGTAAPEVVKFKTNLPEVVSLAFANGREVQSDYSGDQIMYTLDDGRRMYLPPFIGQRIRDLGIRQHEPFEIVKAEVIKGNRRTIEYQVRTLPAARKEPTCHPQPAALSQTNRPQNNTADFPKDYTADLERSIAHAQATRGVSAATPAATPSLMQHLEDTLVEACIHGLKAGKRIETAATDIGLDITLTEATLERLGVTLYIEYNKRSSR